MGRKDQGTRTTWGLPCHCKQKKSSRIKSTELEFFCLFFELLSNLNCNETNAQFHLFGFVHFIFIVPRRSRAVMRDFNIFGCVSFFGLISFISD